MPGSSRKHVSEPHIRFPDSRVASCVHEKFDGGGGAVGFVSRRRSSRTSFRLQVASAKASMVCVCRSDGQSATTSHRTNVPNSGRLLLFGRDTTSCTRSNV